MGSFLETNVRLYSVDATGRRGVVFVTLECDRLAVVAGARAAFGLPYRWSRLAFSRRWSPGGPLLAYALRGRGRRAATSSRLVVEVGPRCPTPTQVGLLADVGFGDLARRPPDHVLASPGVTTRFALPTDAARARRTRCRSRSR